jgi:valyl-tRNA synthetase
MPFITEEIYQGLYADNISIHISKWPQSQAEYLLTDSEQSIIDELFRIIEAVRAYKSQNAISLGKEIEEFTYTSSQDLTPYHQFLEKSLRVAHIVQKSNPFFFSKRKSRYTSVSACFSLFMQERLSQFWNERI